jgi:hypothetical protein
LKAEKKIKKAEKKKKATGASAAAAAVAQPANGAAGTTETDSKRGKTEKKDKKKAKQAVVPTPRPKKDKLKHLPKNPEKAAAKKAKRLAKKQVKLQAQAAEAADTEVNGNDTKPEEGKKRKKDKEKADKEAPAAEGTSSKKSKKAKKAKDSTPVAEPVTNTDGDNVNHSVPSTADKDIEATRPKSPDEAPAVSPDRPEGPSDPGGNDEAGKPQREGSAARAFQRVSAEEWLGKKGSWSNDYVATFGADGWGFKAQQVLGQVRGKDFRHEKTKKKRGSYKGGAIDPDARFSYKFESDDGE